MSFWQSASSAVQAFGSTLDKLDQMVLNDGDDSGDDDAERAESDEMVACRALLEKSQMDIVQISQQSRVLLAEKEASINMWRQKYHEATGKMEPADMSALIDMEALLTERNALLANLSDLEEKLKEDHAALSGPKLKAQMYDDLITKYNRLNEDYSKLVAQEEHKNREESETIEHLVSEYTNLGAEFERRQATDAARIQEVEQQNEVLIMKILAMEHSITDFADRASTSTGSPSASGDNGGGLSSKELKELRAKIVNLQFDIKERDDEIIQLKDLAARDSSRKSANDEVAALQADLAKLLVEKEELEAVGKTAFEEAQRLRKELQSLQDECNDSDKLATAKKNEDELTRLRDEVSVLVTDLDDKTVQCSGFEKEIAMLRLQVSSLEGAARDAKVSADQSEEEAFNWKRQLQECTAQVDQNEVEAKMKLASANDAIAELEKKMSEALESHKADLAASASGSEADLSNRIEREVLAERAKMQAETENALNNLRVELEDSCVLMIQQKHDEMTLSSSQNLKDLKASCDVERDEALKKQAEESMTKLTNSLEELRCDLEKSALEETQRQLSELNNKMELDIEKIVVKEREKADIERVAAVQKQKDDDEALLRQTCENIREEMTRTLTGNSEEKVLALEAEFEERLNTAVLDERSKAQEELAFAVKKQMDSDAVAEKRAVDAAVESLRRDLESAEEDKIASLRAEFDVTLANAIASEQQTAREESKVALEKQISDDEILLKRAVDDVREELTKLHSEKISELTEILNSAHALALAIERENADSNHAAALLDVRDQNEKSKNNALAELKQTMDAELSQALAKAAADLQIAVESEKENSKAALENCIAEWTRCLEEKAAELAAAKSELDAMKNDFVEKLQAEIDDISKKKDVEKADAISVIRKETDAMVAKAHIDRDEYLALYTKEYKQRKIIHNKLIEIQGNIRVICRVRPVLEVERKNSADCDVTEIPNEDTIIIHRDIATRNRYEFDNVFSPTSSQEQVFDAVQPLVISVLDGYNICIFAYGQTGSGKTFTMEGSPDNIGVSPRAINELFRIIGEASEDWSYTVTFSTLEIYNETIRDLLDTSAEKEKLDVRQTPQGNSVPGLTEVQVTSPAQVLSLMTQGQANRAVGSHDMNEHSSRSHSILTLVCQGKSLRDGNTTYGKLHLIDLAGSERVGKTDASGDRLKEAQNINRSLSALGDVINALGNKKNSHVPYRNSKLTFLLQDSLGGNSKVLMFVNISPAIYNLGETVCSLNFAARCRNVELGSAKKQIDKGQADEGAPPLIKALVKRSGSGVGSSATSAPDSASRRSTFGTPTSRK